MPIFYCVDAGDLAGATAAFSEAEALREATGMEPGIGGGLAQLAALRDEETAAADVIARYRTAGLANEGFMLDFALAVLYNGAARYPEALDAAQRSLGQHPAGGFGQGFAELAEAGVRCGRLETARAALDGLTNRTQLGGNDWGLGIEVSCRALVTDGQPAGELYWRRSSGWAGPGCGCRSGSAGIRVKPAAGMRPGRYRRASRWRAGGLDRVIV